MEATAKYDILTARELRRTQTPSEETLWKALRGHKLTGLGFRRQHPIGRFVADFCCEKAKLIVEVDGGYHESQEQQAQDMQRTAHLMDFGYVVLRVTVEDVMVSLDDVLARIKIAANNRNAVSNERLPSPVPTGEGPGVGAFV